MKNWRTSLGGAMTVTGGALAGIGVLTQLTQLRPSTNVLSDHQLATLWDIALFGFVLSALGKGIGFFFSADSKVVKEMQETTEAIRQQTNVNTVQIADTKNTVDNKMNE